MNPNQPDSHDRVRKRDLRESDLASAALPFHLLRRGLSGPRQRRLRQAADARRPASSARPCTGWARVSSSSAISCSRCRATDPAASRRRARVDQPHHGDVGLVSAASLFVKTPGDVLRPALSARRRRGRLLSRHRAVSDVLVSGSAPRPHERALHDRHSGGGRGRRSAVGLDHAGVQRRARLSNWQWLFLLEAVPSLVLGVLTLFMLPNGIRAASWLERQREAASRSQHRTRRAGAAPTFAEARRVERPRVAARRDLLLLHDGPLRRELLSADAHQDGRREGRARRSACSPRFPTRSQWCR